MAKINQIQNALKELDGGAFQKLSDSYLLKKGYPQTHPIGSVSGSNKVRKGTPDTLIPIGDGNYIFAEYTTIAEAQVYRKFVDDITKCLDESKTGVPTSKIREIVLCYTSELSAENIDKLQVLCKESGVNLNLFGLGTISYDLLGKYPKIAKDYLGVEVDTGQIVPLDEFISLYESNKLATTLQTKFQFRADEKDRLLSLIQGNNLIIISGKAGVGKSRIAIECYREYLQENDTYKAYCIFNRGVDLFEDSRTYFSDSGDFLIFVDDANRISGFQYIVKLLQTKRSDQNFKIIVTVRDYALDKIREMCQPVGCNAEIVISSFSDEEIKKILQTEFDIHHHLYLDRIVDIAQGNPRIAVMAAQVAKGSNTLESIRDVSGLYDQYYSSIKSDLDILENGNILKVAGIVAFFRSVDRTNDSLMSDIERVFEISNEDFWEASKKLHDMEVLDIFENEVVKISDQVLSTYLFYLVFFKEKWIDFSLLIKDFFPQYKQRLIDAINPILNTFNVDDVKKIMESAIDGIWDVMREKDESDFLQLIDVFWFLKPTETLLFIQDKISNIESQEIIFNEIKFEADSNLSLPQFLSTLSLFRCFEEDRIKMSLELFLKYAEKKPLDTPQILNCLIDGYGFQPESYRCDYRVQHVVIDELLEYSDLGSNEYFTRLFIALVENYLYTHFSNASSGRGHTVTFTQFDLPASQSLFKLRQNILKYLFNLYESEEYQKSILKLLLSYTQSGVNISVREIVESDSNLILPFFKISLDQNNLDHCIVVQQYLKLLKRFNVQAGNDLKALFQSSDYELYDLLTNKFERVELKLSGDAYRKYKSKKIERLTSTYSKEDYDKLFNQVLNISSTIEGNNKWHIDQGVYSILNELASRSLGMFCEVIRYYLEQGDCLDINPGVVVSNLFSSLDSVSVFSVLNTPEYPSKNRWLFSYYQHLPCNEIQSAQINVLYDLYNESEYKYFIYDIDYLLKYESIQKGFVADVVQIILKRAKTSPEFVHSLSLIFNPHTEINKILNSVFLGKFNLLEEAYIAIDKIEQHADYDGKTLSTILDNDDAFIERYLEDKFSRKEYLSRHDDSRDYLFIWLRDDYVAIMQRITSVVFKNERSDRCFGYYELFYSKRVNPQLDSSILEKQNKSLLKEIESASNKNDYMQFLFSVIVSFSRSRKLMFYQAFLDKNKEFDDFQNLPFEPTSSSWSGSAVPMWQEKIDFYEEVTKICNSIALLKHRQFIEQKIKGIRNRIKHEKKIDFTEE